MTLTGLNACLTGSEQVFGMPLSKKYENLSNYGGTIMMEPDVNIAIAYRWQIPDKSAQKLRNKLSSYIKQGYPVNVSLVKEDLGKIGRDNAVRQDRLSRDLRIAEKMEAYFSDFDCAIFLFDTNGEAHPENGEVTPLLSSNLVYEYGLASSSFINRSTEKRIYCFAPKSIGSETLKYIKGIDLITYDKDFLDVHVKGIEQQTDYIIHHYIHELVMLKSKSFYGLPERLPPLGKAN